MVEWDDPVMAAIPTGCWVISSDPNSVREHPNNALDTAQFGAVGFTKQHDLPGTTLARGHQPALPMLHCRLHGRPDDGDLSDAEHRPAPPETLTRLQST
jgi:hypothetical protein